MRMARQTTVDLSSFRNDGNRHDFSHYINQFSFLGDDEYDLTKAKYGNEMKQKLGLNSNPLDGTVARVSIPLGSMIQDIKCQFPCYIKFQHVTSSIRISLSCS